jgi:hypothetical protein
MQQLELALQLQENENEQLRAQKEQASEQAQELARTWRAANGSVHSSPASANFVDVSSGSGTSQPGALATLVTGATDAYMNVFKYRGSPSDAPTNVPTVNSGHGWVPSHDGSSHAPLSIPVGPLVDLADPTPAPTFVTTTPQGVPITIVAQPTGVVDLTATQTIVAPTLTQTVNQPDVQQPTPVTTTTGGGLPPHGGAPNQPDPGGNGGQGPPDPGPPPGGADLLALVLRMQDCLRYRPDHLRMTTMTETPTVTIIERTRRCGSRVTSGEAK